MLDSAVSIRTALCMAAMLLAFGAASLGAAPRIVDAPADPADAVASHRVLQIIEGRFYKWDEFLTALPDGGESVWIRQIEPFQADLTAAEAMLLLEASASWIDEAPVNARSFQAALPTDSPLLTALPKQPVAVDDPAAAARLAAQPGELYEIAEAIAADAAPAAQQPVSADTSTGWNLVGGRAIIGVDNRVRNTATTTFPSNTGCYTLVRYGSSYFRGTSFLVAPYTALTAAHLVYDKSLGGFANEALVYAGQSQTAQGATPSQPYGERQSTLLRTNSRFIDTSTGGTTIATSLIPYDFGAIQLGSAIAGISTYMPIQIDATMVVDEAITLFGYPVAALSESSSLAQWVSAGSVIGLTNNVLEHSADTTPGNSGSPIYRFVGPGGERRIVAIVSAGNSTSNKGCYLRSEIEALVQSWMNYSPFQPVNDNFASATTLSGASGSVSGFNNTATRETGEPTHAGVVGSNSVWYRWTAPFTGTVSFGTFGSGFDTALAVYTGTTLTGLSAVVGNDDDTPDVTYSRVSFLATSGVTYMLAVEGKSGAQGAFALAWNLSACTYSLSVNGQSMGQEGGLAAFAVLAGTGCSWTATESSSWLNIQTGASGVGSGDVVVNVSPNPAFAERTAAVTVTGAGLAIPFTVTQSGVAPVDDVFEENDALESPRALPSNQVTTNLVLLDADWYEITLPTALTHLSVVITFDSSLGNVNADLWDTRSRLSDWGLRVGEGYSTTASSERMTYVNTTGCPRLLLRVYGEQGATNPNYTVSLTTFEGDDILEGSNDNPLTPTRISYSQQYTSLICRNDDWYVVDVTGLSSVRVVADHYFGSGDLHMMAVTDPANPFGSIIAGGYSSDVTKDYEEMVVTTTGIQQLYIRVYGHQRQSNFYGLRVVAP